MKLKYLLAAFVVFITAQVYAQTGRTVSGVVKDTTGITLPGTTVKIFTGKDSSVVATDPNGRYTFSGVTVNQFSLLFYYIGYKPLQRRIILNDDTMAVELATVILNSDAIALQGVTIRDVNAIKLKEDTVEYNAAAYK